MISAMLCLVLGALGGIIGGGASAFADVRATDMIKGVAVEDLTVQSNLLPSVDAEYAILLDDDGDIYFERNATAETHIASITKVMTAIVCLEYADLTREITISNYAATVGESSAMLLEGDRLTIEEALVALLIPSGNDAAVAIAENVGAQLRDQGFTVNPEAAAHFNQLGVDLNAMVATTQPLDIFVAAMNDMAFSIGMDNSVFANAHGLDSGAYTGTMYSTASDVARMCSYAMKNETFRSIVATGDTTIAVVRADGTPAEIFLESTDELIGTYEGACGIKTGYTDAAGNSFAGACDREGELLYAIVLSSTSEKQRFTDAENLYNWYYNNQKVYSLINSDQWVDATINGTTKSVPVVAEVSHDDWIDKTVKATVSDPDATVEVFALDGNISQSLEFDDLSGDITVGEKVGTITFYQHNNAIAEMDLIACEDVAGPNFLEGVSIWWQRLFGGLSGEDESAESVTINDTPLIFDKTSLNRAA